MKPHNSNSVFFYGDMRNNVICWDDKQADFYPQVKILNLNNEFNYSIRLHEEMTFGNKHRFTADGIEAGRDSKAFLENKNFKNECYTGSDMFEWFIYIKKKPLTNKIYFTINDKGIVWNYQGILTPEEIAQGCKRPDEIEGSYALYCPKQNHIIGGTNYMAGKVGSVPAPYVVLSDGSKVKCQMTIENGLLVIEIPLDIYLSWNWDIPLLLDPTFGYTTHGGTYEETGQGYYRVYGSLFACSNNMSIDSITAYLGYADSDLADDFKCLICASDKNLLTNGVSDEKLNSIRSGTMNEIPATYTNKPTVASGSSYYLCFMVKSATSGAIYTYYDTGDANQGLYDSANNYTSPESPTDASSNTKKYTIYATGTESGGSSSIKKYHSVALAGIKKADSVAIAGVKKIMTVVNT